MALQTGQWSLKGDGFEGELTISSVDAQGHVEGSVNEHPLEGYWDDQAGKLVFTSMNLSNLSTIQIFTGYLHTYVLVDVVKYRLAGSVETISATADGVQRGEGGWIADTGGPIVR